MADQQTSRPDLQLPPLSHRSSSLPLALSCLPSPSSPARTLSREIPSISPSLLPPDPKPFRLPALDSRPRLSTNFS
ncbi:hypothetical protein GQ607_003712 [Colletotrichum asianum]|uniref:Uncharacterized protein n=1 Tax=Colletotrichum asianum TaxID=702518 RepID=A0A8H3WLD7_9PEZI|nr:hypothetical protein GQ607_003712 [Colletotrichum asianum]